MVEFQKGVVDWFDSKGLGLIIPDLNPDVKIIVHYSSIDATGGENDNKNVNLKPNQRVKFKSTKTLGREITSHVIPL